jgi:Kef-type K+ transport system membrane component KefB/mannitol/fructose-specific phosphotransferase system IIA component (Ntr-type)
MDVVSEYNLLIFLVQFALLLGACKVVGYFLEKINQPTITGDILVGLILGPAIFGRYLPEIQSAIFPDNEVQWAMLSTVAWFGNLFLLMETGLGINFSRVWNQRKKAIRLSLADLSIPLIISFIPFYFIPEHYLVDPSQRLIFALFIACIMTISALPVAIRGLRDLGILNTDVGFLIVSALTMNDVAGWVLFTIVLGIFSHGMIEVGFILQLIVLTLLFTLVSLTLFRRLVDKAVTFIHTKISSGTGYKTTFIVIVGMLFGAMTLRIGIHSLFGFFMAGIVLGEAKHITERDRHTIHRMVYSIFVPIFFANIGLHVDILANLDWLLVLVITSLGIAARYAGAYVGSCWARQDKENIGTIAISHVAGGEMHIVVTMLAFSAGLITEKIFVSVVAAAIFSTIIFGPWLSLNLGRFKRRMLNYLFSRDHVWMDTRSRTRRELLDRMISVVAESTGLEESYLHKEIYIREERLTTSIGQGIAFPHAHVKGIPSSKLFVVKATHDIEWDSPDGAPVHLVFLTLSPEDKPETQLRLSQDLVSALRQPRILEDLMQSDDPDYIHSLLKKHIKKCDNCLVNE